MKNVLKHGLVQAEIRNQPLQLSVLLLKLTQALDLRGHQTGVSLPPVVERRFRNPGLATDLANSRAFFSLLQAKAICASVNFDAFMELSISRSRDQNWNIPAQNGPIPREHVTVSHLGVPVVGPTLAN